MWSYLPVAGKGIFMRGGYFDYVYVNVNEFSEDLNFTLDTEHALGYCAEVRSELNLLAKDALALSRRMKAAEWLLSEDIGEEDFLRRIGKTS